MVDSKIVLKRKNYVQVFGTLCTLTTFYMSSGGINSPYIFDVLYFFLNFFIGVLFVKYIEVQKEEQKGFTNDHINWIAI